MGKKREKMMNAGVSFEELCSQEQMDKDSFILLRNIYQAPNICEVLY